MQALTLKLAQSRLGRVMLHLVVLCVTWHVQFHLAGIVREVKGI